MPAEYTGFEMNGYDEDKSPKSIPIKNIEHKQFQLTPIHSTNAHGNVFNQGQTNHDGTITISVKHDEHHQSYKREKNVYSIVRR